MALRGDPPGGVGTRFVPHPEGYRNAADLVRGIRELGDFEVSVSAYPERHPESVSIEEDLAFMADKAEHGATPRHLAVLLPQCLLPAPARPHRGARHRHRAGAGHPADHLLRPGAANSPQNAARIFRPRLPRRFEGLDEDPETRNLVAAMVAAEQVDALRREGVKHFHFYTLNRADLVYAICRVLGLGSEAKAA